jgi:hypothetical protein
LTAGAAWLYQEFATGGLGGYGFVYTFGTARQQDDNLLQAAIWDLQGGQSYPSYNGNNQFYLDAITALGLSGATSAYTGTSIEVMQMWDSNGNAAQNQLVFVPEVSQTAGLLGIGFLGVLTFRFLNRKLAHASSARH